ncbi:MAG: DUF2007 domain-containing protein [Alphaproteobacteria bacterium]
MPLKPVLKTTDPVLLSAVEAALSGAQIPSLRMDEHMSVMEGSIGVLPRRLMVVDEDFEVASAIAREVEGADG